MRIRSVSILLIIVFVISLSSCGSAGGSFSIRFIDVGQGDSALIECDGHYMLIDGGPKKSGDNVYHALEREGIQHLDILVISHFHADHYAGLPKALTYISKVDLALSNADTYKNGIGKDEDAMVEDSDTERNVFNDFESALRRTGATIRIPKSGEKYNLGSATVEVVDVASEKPNDSVVILLSYGKTRFLFTGDIEYSGQKRLVEKYTHGGDAQFKVDVLKIPHHGSWGQLNANDSDLYRLIRTFNPDYAVISVGVNSYGHPHRETLDLLDQADVKVYRTDQNGDIVVLSDGKKVSIKTTR